MTLVAVVAEVVAVVVLKPGTCVRMQWIMIWEDTCCVGVGDERKVDVTLCV